MSLWNLCINLQAPMQSWGVDGKISFRSTSSMPSRSGIIGLLASAMGIEREDELSLSQLNKLRINTISLKSFDYIEKDFHTIEGALAVDGSVSKVQELSDREYLVNSHYIVMLEGKKEYLEKIAHSLHYPKWHVFLGRKCCPPASPFLLGNYLKEGSFEELFAKPGKYRCFMEISEAHKADELIVKSDLDYPLSFKDRKFEKRNYLVNWVDIENIRDAINSLIFKEKEVSNYDKFY